MTKRSPHIVGFGGTTSESSATLSALVRVLGAAGAQGATTELLPIHTLDIPMYAWGRAPTPDVQRMSEAFRNADAIVWASPLYHGTISGLFKNAIDWLEILADRDPPYLTDKPIGLIGVSAGVQSLQAITAMEQIARALRGWAIPLVVPVHRAPEVFEKDGAVKDARVDKQLAALGAELVRAATLFAARPA